MAWYYAQGVERFGPLTEEEFQQAAGSGTVNSATLVWREGMVRWQPYGQVAGVGVAVAEGGVCSQCRRSFVTDELVSYEGHVVCAECKPTFLQRIREGVIAPIAMRYAGFWIRFVALMIDSFALSVILGILFLVAGMVGYAVGSRRSPGINIALGLVIMFLMWAVPAAYVTIMVGRWGATLGKMAIGLKIVQADGGRVGYWRAFGRGWAWLLSYIILFVGFIIAGFDSKKRALHDYICDTRVIWR